MCVCVSVCVQGHMFSVCALRVWCLCVSMCVSVCVSAASYEYLQKWWSDLDNIWNTGMPMARVKTKTVLVH